MAGLLDALGSDEGLLGLYLMSAGAAKPVRTSLGEGLLGGVQMLQQRKLQEEDRRQKKALQDMQMQLMGAQIGETKAQEAERRAKASQAAALQSSVEGLLGRQGAPTQYGAAGGGINLGGVQEPMRPQQGGLAGVPIEAVAAIKARGGPDLLDAWKLANLGQQTQPGWVQKADGSREYLADPTKGFGFDGKNVTLLPGAAESQAALAGATKQAEARANAMYDLVQGEGAGGKPGLVGTRAGIAERFNQQPQPEAPQSPVMDRIRAAMARNGDTSANFDIGGMRGSIGGQQGGFIPTGQGPREKTVTDAVTLGNQAFMKDRYAPALEGGDAATQTIAATQAARNALNSMGRTGWGTPLIATSAAVLGALGVPQAEKFASSAQMFQSAAMGRLWTTLNAAKGPQTEGDADRASKTFARVENTPEANAFILDMTQATAERERLKAQYFREALPLAQQSGDLQEIERRWSRIAPSIFSMPTMKRWAQ